MAGLGRVVVGYRENDRRRLRLIDTFGIAVTPVRKCAAGCGHLVYFTPSGIAACRDRDAEVICDECKQSLPRDAIILEL